MLDRAEKDGKLKKGYTIVEATAFSTAPNIPFSLGVFIILAPKALIKVCFSIENFSGTTKIILYPLFIAASAIPIPVFPAVASTMVYPFFNFPSF